MKHPRTMKALVKGPRGVSLEDVPRPRLEDRDVLVRVAMAGICRTDLYAARGLVAAADRVILGHEFAGAVCDAGDGVNTAKLAVGARVAVNPVLPCGACARCLRASGPCSRPTMLGVDRHGAFAELVAVPEEAIHVLPDSVDFAMGAYAEPVAAALAVMRADVHRHERGAVFGANRIARLTQRLLAAHGFAGVATHDPESGEPLPEDGLDFAVETDPGERALAAMMRAVRAGGLIVLKSRPPAAVPLDLAAAVRKELRLQAVAYAPFGEAVALIASGRVPLDDLLGSVRPLGDFPALAAHDRVDETLKTFLSPEMTHVRDRRVPPA